MANTNTSTTKPNEIVPAIEIDKKILKEAKRQFQFERQVIVHCSFLPGKYGTTMRIWRSTFLRDQESPHKSKLLNAFNITFFPEWKDIPGGKAAKFILIFSALPRRCKSFDLFEDIPELGGFYSKPLSRNKTDVYFIDIFS
jgi:hypothetical protein